MKGPYRMGTLSRTVSTRKLWGNRGRDTSTKPKTSLASMVTSITALNEHMGLYIVYSPKESFL